MRLRKALSLLLALCMVLGLMTVTASAAETAVSYTKYSWDESTNTLSSTTETTTKYTVVTKDLIKESSGGTGKGLLSGTYVVNSDTTIEDYVYIRKGCTVNLIVQSGVTLTCKKGIGCGYDKNKEYATLNIFGSGKIVTTGEKYTAGIGGKDNEASGNISIHGTTITAKGGYGGAGIGGGDGGKDPDGTTSIRIYDGTINATGGKYGAGIGGGDEQPGAHTYIYGGTITATSEGKGAGIGGGDEEGTLGVFIYGGIVKATGGDHGAGIGAGEGGGNLRKAENGGGVNILGGNVTAVGGNGGAGIGGGWFENMSGTVIIAGSPESVTVNGGVSAAGIGGGNGLNGSAVNCDGDMKGTITIDSSSDGLIKITGGTFGGAGIGAGLTGNMDGKVYIKNGNIEVYAGYGGAGIGGGLETDNTGAGGEGGDVYVGGGTLKVFGNQEYSDAQAIGYGMQACPFGTDPSGSVYISHDKNKTGNYMRVAYKKNDDKTYSTAEAGKRSSKCHQDEVILIITECDHRDYYGKSGLTYSIDNEKTHTVKCKYCGYEAGVTHTVPDCECGYSRPRRTVTLNSLTGIETAVIAEGYSFTLPYTMGEIVTGNTIPTSYFEVKGWTLTGDPSGMIYEAGSDVTVNTDMEFTLVTEPVYVIECTETENGRISSDLDVAKAGDTIKIKVLPDAGYFVRSVAYTYIVDFDPGDGYLYADPVRIPGEEGAYQLTMPQLNEPANGILVTAEFVKDEEQPISVLEVSDGKVSADRETARFNEEVTLTVTPDEGFALSKIRCTTVNGEEVELTKVSDTIYTFRMPGDGVNVSADFDELSAWVKLQAAIDALADSGTITLTEACVAGADDTALVIPEGSTITIDLNGCAIDRNLYDPIENGCVLVNNA